MALAVPFVRAGAGWVGRGARASLNAAEQLADANRASNQVHNTASVVRQGDPPPRVDTPPAREPAPRIGDHCSFSPDTPVATDAGPVAISELRLGDEVTAYHEGSGTTDSYPVTAVWAEMHHVIEHLIIDGKTIETTAEHPFYTEEGWTAAADLRVGALVRQADGSYAAVEAVTFTRSSRVMYNLTVETAHTYFVGQGEWLVHNECPNPHGSRGGPDHRDAIDRRVRELEQQGYEHVGGGSKNELVVRTPGGHKSSRRPDLTMEDTKGSRCHEDVGLAMATRGIQFFATLEEYSAILDEVRAEREVFVIVQSFASQTQELSESGSLSLADGTAAHAIMLAEERPTQSQLETGVRNPAKAGWLTGEVPRVQGSRLYLASIGAKSDYYDAATHSIIDNPVSIQLFQAIARYFRRRLVRPVYAYNILDNESIHCALSGIHRGCRRLGARRR